MFIAILETQNFIFHAAGNTESEARQALVNGICEHCKQSQGRASLVDMLDYVDEANIIDIGNGECLRDYGKFYGSQK